MFFVNECRFFPYSSEQIFQLIADVEAYPTYVPGVLAAEVTIIHANCFKAEMLMGHKLLREHYLCNVHLTPYRCIEIEYLRGPFNNLENIWHFVPKAQGVEVHFSMGFDFSSRVVGSVVKFVLPQLISSMIEAFVQRADKLFEPGGEC